MPASPRPRVSQSPGLRVFFAGMLALGSLACVSSSRAFPEDAPAQPVPSLVSLELERIELLRGGLPLSEHLSLAVARVASRRPGTEAPGDGETDGALAGRRVTFSWEPGGAGAVSGGPLLFGDVVATDARGEAHAIILSGEKEGEFRLAAECEGVRLCKTIRQVSVLGPRVWVGRAPDLPKEPAWIDAKVRARIREEVRGLSAKDHSARDEAFGLLVGEGRAALTELARTSLDPETPDEIKALCGRAIGQIRDEEALRTLLALLTDPRPSLQQVAEWGLRPRGLDAVGPFLQLALDNRAPHVRAGALRAMAEFRDPKWSDAAKESLADADPLARACAAWCRVRSASAEKGLPEARKGAAAFGLRAALGDASRAVRRATVRSICRRMSEEVALGGKEYLPAGGAGRASLEDLVAALDPLRAGGALVRDLCDLAALAAKSSDDEVRGSLAAGLKAMAVAGK